MAVDLAKLNADIQSYYKDHWIYDYTINEDLTITAGNDWCKKNFTSLSKSLFRGKDIMICDTKSGILPLVCAMEGANHVQAFEVQEYDIDILSRACEFLNLQGKITINNQNAFVIDQSEVFIDQDNVDSVDYLVSVVNLSWKYYNKTLGFDGITKVSHLYTRHGLLTDFPNPQNMPEEYNEENYITSLEKYYNTVACWSGYFLATSKKDV